MIAPRILVACHCSMTVVDDLRALGADAWSIDLNPPERPSPFHIVGDARCLLSRAWDGLIASPTCTRMANSGSKHLYVGMKKENGRAPERWALLEQDAAFFRLFSEADHIPVRLVENSIMHEHAAALVGRRQDQVMQPWHHGDPYFKGTAVWLYGMDRIADTNRLTPPRPGTDEHKRWSAVHRAAPGPNRAADRARTFPGMSKAWAAAVVAAINARHEPLPLFRSIAA